MNGAYGYPLHNVLLPFCAREGIETAAGLDRRTLDRLASELLEQGGLRGRLTKATVHSYLRPINHLLAWARDEGEAGDARAQLPRLPRRDIEILTREEIDSMEDKARAERDKLIIRVLADTGIRVGELTGLRMSDLIERDRKQYIRVRGKGDRERLVPIPGIYRRLRRYADRGRPQDAVSDRLFMGLKRRAGGDYEPLTDSGVQQMIRIVAAAAGIKRRIHPHLFRHSFATWQLTRGMNPIQLAQIMGHTSLAMIQQVYAHLAPSDAYDAMLRTLQAEG